MYTANILLTDILPYVLDLIIILAILRIIFIAVIVFTLILANRMWDKSYLLNPDKGHRTSPSKTTEVNFNEFLTGFSKPFWPEEVY